MGRIRSIASFAAVVMLVTAMVGTATAERAVALTCAASVGPGIPPPASLPSGIPGFHAAWYGQSGYPTLCPGGRSTATVAYYNTGSLGWVGGKMGESAYLGTWGPEPGQDQITPLGGDGAEGTPNTGWPRYDRIAVQPSPYVGPGQVAWFQFTIQAPATPGYYRLYLRPLIEGATWMEDFGVFWLVKVLNPDGSAPPSPTSLPVYSTTLGYSQFPITNARGTFVVNLVKARLADVAVRTLTANTSDCANACPTQPLDRYVSASGGFAGMNGTYFCPPDYAECAGKVSSFDYAVYNSDLGRWINQYAFVSPTNALASFVGGTPRFYRHIYTYDRSAVTAAISNFPLLVQNGGVVDSEAEQSAYQKLAGTKGSIGTDGLHVYLALISNANVTDTAYVLQSLGIRDAMNMDGGGSSALYSDGAYRVGPGRLLPNAVVLVRR